VAKAQAKHERFSRAASLAELDPESAALARNLARSARAEMQLLRKSIDYETSGKKARDEAENERTLSIYRLLGMRPPTPGQNPSASGKTET
jgi:hypothetical protein